MTPLEKNLLRTAELSFSCNTKIQDTNLHVQLANVFVQLSITEHIEIKYIILLYELQ